MTGDRGSLAADDPPAGKSGRGMNKDGVMGRSPGRVMLLLAKKGAMKILGLLRLMGLGVELLTYWVGGLELVGEEERCLMV